MTSVAESQSVPRENSSEQSDESNWAAILGAVNAPLGFFALALLVIEAPFPVFYGLSAHTPFELELSVSVMGGLIIAVVVVVALLTLFAPKDLVQRAADRAAESAAHRVAAEQKHQIETAIRALQQQ